MSKIVSAKAACALIKDEDTIGISGFAFGFGFAEEVARAVEERYIDEGHPKNLTLLYGSGCGDAGKSNFGQDHFAHEGMIKRVVAGHVGLAHKLSRMIHENKVEAYNFPQGVITHLFREIAGKRPGVVTHVGLQTFADPRVEGGKMNASAQEDLIEVIEISGQERLLYKSMPVNVAIIRGTTADEFGNITIEKEGVYLEAMHVAQAAKNSGGIVIAQVERIACRGTLHPLDVRIPGIMVDYIVKADKENHRMNAGVDYDPAFSGEVKVPMDSLKPMEMTTRKIIAKRCAMELELDTTINLGIGVPEGIAAIALEEGINERLTMTIEAGSIGGIPGAATNLGGAANVEAIIGQPNIFDYYDGGGLDSAFLGLAQADAQGNINVSKFGTKMVGCGGFVNITQNTRKVIFCGTFTAGRSQIEITGSGLNIIEDGPHIKFINNVEQITFSGNYATATDQEVLYITERAVFKLTKEGMMLTEIAPGVDLEKDIIGKMAFKPVISKNLITMDHRIFNDRPMGLKDRGIDI